MNKIVLRSNVKIGENGAENDDAFLFKCFVDHPAFAEVINTGSSVSFLLGSTGVGKTAIIRMVANGNRVCEELELQSMAMSYISNSDTINFLQGLEVDLTLFFQSLWKHILCIEYIKVALSAPSPDQFRFKVRRILDDVIKVREKARLEEFVDRYENQFWNTIDENLIELVDNFSKELNIEMGGEFKKFVGKAGYLHNLGSQQKVQLQQRARKFVSDNVIGELPSVVSALRDYTARRQDQYYILVDGLDEHWVDAKIKFQLLQALFESLRALRKVRNFQVVGALRNDLYHRMVDETPSSHRQIEKYEDLILRLKWTKGQLRELADKRINHLFRHQYHSSDVHFDDVFKQQPDGKTTPWDYILQRTLMRPRDVINFISLSLQESEGKSAVSKTAFLRAEGAYSELRRDTLVHEWSGTIPGVKVYLELLRSAPAYREASEFMHTKFIDRLYDELGKEPEYQKDILWKEIEKFVNEAGQLDPVHLAQQVLSRLHLIGAIGLKLQQQWPWDWIYESARPVNAQQIHSDTKFKVHPMLYASLDVRTRRPKR